MPGGDTENCDGPDEGAAGQSLTVVAGDTGGPHCGGAIGGTGTIAPAGATAGEPAPASDDAGEKGGGVTTPPSEARDERHSGHVGSPGSMGV